MSVKSKNDVAWEALFEAHNILDRVNSAGFCELSASSISKERDARSMTTFHHRIQLPTIFKNNHLTIVPKTRTTYVIGNFESYFNLDTDASSAVEEISLPATFET